ncbi:amidohydrolase 2 [Apiospora hydei]|uniref:Amidohydrolase 2 n=1 Tax=Apiospora hydei TaxID=1337664 RepID=A0ABR1X7K4_9PEZI
MHSFIRAGLLLFPLLPSLTSALPAASIGAYGKYGKPATSGNCTLPPYYTLEEHWLSPSLFQQFLANPLNALIGGGGSPGGGTLPKLREIGAQRLASMDANNIQIQVISHLAAAIAASPAPARFRGFCILPMAAPGAAAAELRRCVAAHGFVGALVDAHLANASYYDGAAYDSLWAAAVGLGVPIYLHPTYPSLADVVDAGTGLYAPSVAGEWSAGQAAALGTVAWGWHERTGFGFLRMYLGGVFERFPELQVILGHMGELVPYYLWRSDLFLSPGLSRTLDQVYAGNAYVTTSGIFSLDPVATLVRNTNRTRILYSVDYPFASNEDGAAFMASLRSSGLVSQAEFSQVAYQNAAQLLKIKTT